jgi:hypothetical protein
VYAEQTTGDANVWHYGTGALTRLFAKQCPWQDHAVGATAEMSLPSCRWMALAFTVEGDNLADAHRLASWVLQQWIMPLVGDDAGPIKKSIAEREQTLPAGWQHLYGDSSALNI